MGDLGGIIRASLYMRALVYAEMFTELYVHCLEVLTLALRRDGQGLVRTQP